MGDRALDAEATGLSIQGASRKLLKVVEELVLRLDDLVIGVPSQKYGQEIMAWVKPREGASLDDEMLTAFCRGKIQKFRMRKVSI